MSRALRILAISGLVVVGVYATFIAVQLRTSGHVATLPLLGERLVLLLDVVRQTILILAFATGIVATVASLQRQRPRWAAVFITLVVVFGFSPELINYLFSVLRINFLLAVFGGAFEIILVQVILPALLAALVLIFTFTPRTEITVA